MQDRFYEVEPVGVQVAFYPSRYAAEKCSILPVGDPTSYIPDSEVRFPPSPWMSCLVIHTTFLRCPYRLCIYVPWMLCYGMQTRI